MAREANASYEGQGQRQSADIPRMKVRLDDLYERINIAGGLNNKIVFGDTGNLPPQVEVEIPWIHPPSNDPAPEWRIPVPRHSCPGAG